MVHHITSNAVVESLDENKGTGLGDNDTGVSGSLTSSSSSDGENDGGPLGQTIDDILLGKTKAKEKGKKAHNAGGTKPSASKCILCICAFFQLLPQRITLLPQRNLQRNIMFNIAMFSAKKDLKDLKKRAGKNAYMVLNNNEPFDTWRAQLLVRIEKTLMPSKLDIKNYEIHFTIARISPSSLMVVSDEEYVNMLEQVGRSKDFACNVYIQELCSSSKVFFLV